LTAACAIVALRNPAIYGSFGEGRIMTVTIELAPDLEAGLAALAKAHGLGLPQYVQRVLKEQVSVQAGDLSPSERAAAWLASTEGLPLTPPLSDEAISREGMYGPRG
jgi:hypothetical protein